LFLDFDKSSGTDSESQKNSIKALKLEAIGSAIGLVISYDRSVLDSFTIGTVGVLRQVNCCSLCSTKNGYLLLSKVFDGLGFDFELL
jgi:nicotinate-nucleotide--dimethylbenzimidazole phosphoribosyltransferase